MLTAAGKNILATLAYFDLFSYPLTIEEIQLFMPAKCDPDEFNYSLRWLVIDRAIFKFDKYYTLKNDYFLIERRQSGNIKAAEMIEKAQKVGRLLIRFPYVRGIAISGSLSKNFADDDSDIDLFIITAKNRLWIARTFMHLFKKLTFLFRKEHYFCMNYYIDEEELLIREKNIYTATEIATLMPLQGDIVFEHFYATNTWIRDFLPNKCMRLATAHPMKRSILKRLVEVLFNNGLGNVVDNMLMKVTVTRWGRKSLMRKKNSKGFIMSMDAGKHYAKPDPQSFQHRLIVRYEIRLTQVFERCEQSVAH
ncbi:MAG: nucleotidyltransferase domain-containing protein [Bacteroidetes bacterium]|nr:nucleotidyltransferase domain-containing protein [Bacteroidota bacterium]